MKLARIAVVFALICAGAQCHSEDDAGVVGLEDVVYVGDVNDEALDLLVKATAVDGKGQGAVLDAPGEASAVAASAPLTFAWHAGATAHAKPQWHRGWQMPELSLISEAYAHGTAVSGKAYFLVVSTPAKPKLLRVFTHNASYTPDAAAWAKLTAETGPLTAKVTTAVYDSGKLLADGGPFLGKAVTFTVKK